MVRNRLRPFWKAQIVNIIFASLGRADRTFVGLYRRSPVHRKRKVNSTRENVEVYLNAFSIGIELYASNEPGPLFVRQSRTTVKFSISPLYRLFVSAQGVSLVDDDEKKLESAICD